MESDLKTAAVAAMLGAVFMLGMLGIALIFGLLFFLDWGARWFSRDPRPLPPYTDNPGRRL